MTLPLMPLLAPSETLTDALAQTLRYPVLVSPKYDGIRASIQSGQLLSRTCKPLPNPYIASVLAAFEGLDGEIVCGDFNCTQSAVMGPHAPGDWAFFAFDAVGSPLRFDQRLQLLAARIPPDHPRVKMAPQRLARSPRELLAIEQSHRLDGWEGVMVRSPDGLYPQKTKGELRSTLRQQNVMKFKRFEDSEGLIVDVYPGADGSSVGGFVLQDDRQGWTCRVNTGRLTAAQLAHAWQAPGDYVGKRSLKYQFQRVGMGALPRFPTAQGFRDQGT